MTDHRPLQTFVHRALNVICPICYADYGEPCLSNANHPHAARTDLWRDLTPEQQALFSAYRQVVARDGAINLASFPRVDQRARASYVAAFTRNQRTTNQPTQPVQEDTMNTISANLTFDQLRADLIQAVANMESMARSESAWRDFNAQVERRNEMAMQLLDGNVFNLLPGPWTNQTFTVTVRTPISQPTNREHIYDCLTSATEIAANVDSVEISESTPPRDYQRTCTLFEPESHYCYTRERELHLSNRIAEFLTWLANDLRDRAQSHGWCRQYERNVSYLNDGLNYPWFLDRDPEADEAGREDRELAEMEAEHARRETEAGMRQSLMQAFMVMSTDSLSRMYNEWSGR